MITIVNYNMGNLGSIQNMLSKVGARSLVTNDKTELRKATKLILPGVGAFDSAILSLRKLEIYEVVKEVVLDKGVPVLGICLGMQLLTQNSEEGSLPGFGFIDAVTKKFHFEDPKMKIPHMGWNLVRQKKESRLFQEMYAEPRFYFVHSYAVRCECEDDVLLSTDYGHEFVSGFEHRNILGVQFHPEKSHKFGIKLFKNFVEYY